MNTSIWVRCKQMTIYWFDVERNFFDTFWSFLAGNHFRFASEEVLKYDRPSDYTRINAMKCIVQSFLFGFDTMESSLSPRIPQEDNFIKLDTALPSLLSFCIILAFYCENGINSFVLGTFNDLSSTILVTPHLVDLYKFVQKVWNFGQKTTK